MANKQKREPSDGWASWQLEEVNRTAGYADRLNKKAAMEEKEAAHREWLKKRAGEMKSPKYKQDKWLEGVKKIIKKK